MRALTDQDLQQKPVILVVEDEEDMRRNLVELLSDEFTVLTAKNGEEALRIYYNEQFHLNVVLLDIRMPDLSGIEVLVRMRKINLNPDVIMVTALSDTETAVAAMRQGAYDYVTKPFFAGDLISTIKRALEKEDYARKLKELTDRLEHERIAAEHRRLLFIELQMKRRVEGRELSAEEKALFNFPVLAEEDYDYDKLTKKLENELAAKVEIGEGANLLILESESELRNSLREILSDNYIIEIASSGREALEIISKKQIDILLLDINVPDMDGMEVLKRVRGGNPLVDVIMVTDTKDIEVAVSTIKLGAYDYITKPFVPGDIKASIERILGKRASKKVLEELLKKYKEARLSFEPRLGMLKELFMKRKSDRKKISMEDVYTFFPEFQEGKIPLAIEVNFPDFRDEKHVDSYIRGLSASTDKNVV